MNFLLLGYGLFACWIRAAGGALLIVAPGREARQASPPRRPVETATNEETIMYRKIAFTALSLAIVLGSASVPAAAAKKHTEAGKAYASTQAAVDPRDVYLAKRKGGDQS